MNAMLAHKPTHKGFKPRESRMGREVALTRGRKRIRRVGHNAHSRDWLNE